jgi:hypothetical protein
LTLIDRESGRACSKPIPLVAGWTVKNPMITNIDKSATIMTDTEASYMWTEEHFSEHHSVNHSKGEYSRKGTNKNGDPIGISSNQAESYFSLLRRGYYGAFHQWSLQHVHRYCSEFDFRWTHRKETDYERTVRVIQGGENKRLTYKALPTGSPFQ